MGVVDGALHALAKRVVGAVEPLGKPPLEVLAQLPTRIGGGELGAQLLAGALERALALRPQLGGMRVQLGGQRGPQLRGRGVEPAVQVAAERRRRLAEAL